MFTGLVTAIGTVADVTPIGDGHDARLTIITPPGWLDGAAEGASIACSGCCLTALDIGPDRFAVDASAETLSLTSLGQWRPGRRINLERSLRLGDELGGHLVSGHVDGLGALRAVRTEEGSLRLSFTAPRDLLPLIARKGSIAVDGVSLTVNDAGRDGFAVNIIPHTAAVTTLGALEPGDCVHLEIDMLARYVARLSDMRLPEASWAEIRHPDPNALDHPR